MEVMVITWVSIPEYDEYTRLYTNIHIALGSCMSFAVRVLFTQNTHVETTDAAAGKILYIFTHVSGAQAAKASEKPTAQRILFAHSF